MDKEFPYVVIPPELLPVIGTPDAGTRMYRQEGSQEASRQWHDIISECFGQLVVSVKRGTSCPDE